MHPVARLGQQVHVVAAVLDALLVGAAPAEAAALSLQGGPSSWQGAWALENKAGWACVKASAPESMYVAQRMTACMEMANG